MFKFSVISPNATYQLNTSVSPVDEGQSSTITLTTTGVQNGQAIPYTISGVGITTDDISGDPLSGNFIVQNGAATKTLNIAADLTTEGQETLTMSLGNGTNVTLTVNDTSLTPSAGDVYWDNVSLMVHADGTDNGTTFADVKGHTVTAAGDAKTSTSQAKFGTSSMSVTRNGNGYLNISNGGDILAFGTSDFTVEFWMYRSANPVAAEWWMQHNTSGGMLIGFENTTQWGMAQSGSGWVVRTTTALPLNQWNHIAFARSGGQTRIYLNGVQQASAADTRNYVDTTLLNIVSSTGATGVNGYLDEIRVTKGAARYTSNFTAPIAASTDTKNENVDPFWNNVSLLMHMDGANNGTTFTDVKNHTFTAFGNAITSTAQQKFGTASAYFDGVGDYISTPTSTDFDMSGDFTIEAWVRFSELTGNHVIVDRWASGNAGSWQLYWRSTGSSLAFYVGGAVVLQDPSNSTIGTNQWYHVAICRTGTTVRMFVNGVQRAINTNFTTNLTNTLPLMLGCQGSTTTNFLKGYVDDVRITKSPRYIGAFTPPTRSFAETA